MPLVCIFFQLGKSLNYTPRLDLSRHVFSKDKYERASMAGKNLLALLSGACQHKLSCYVLLSEGAGVEEVCEQQKICELLVQRMVRWSFKAHTYKYL